MSKYISFSSAETNPDLDIVQDVSPDEVSAKRAGVKLIDVRSSEEYFGELGHIAGAELIPLETLVDRLDQLPKDQTIVFICRSGRRSASAAALAADQGLTSVYNMKGGMMLWNAMDLAVERSES